MPLIRVEKASKIFTLHLREGARIAALQHVSFDVSEGECVVLRGPSGSGKSTLLKMIYGNYRCNEGKLLLRDGNAEVDVARASPRRILGLRRTTVAYVTQFLRVVPRVPTLDIVEAEARTQGHSPEVAREHAAAVLTELNLPKRLWGLPPATFSGGEQQRVNVARGFIANHPILLLDEPTASLDKANRDAVVRLIERKKRAGVALLGIFHDEDVRDRIADRFVDLAPAA